MIISRSIHVAANGITPFFYDFIVFFCICIPHLSSHSFVDGHLGYFHVLPVINGAAMNIGRHVYFELENIFLWVCLCASKSMYVFELWCKICFLLCTKVKKKKASKNISVETLWYFEDGISIYFIWLFLNVKQLKYLNQHLHKVSTCCRLTITSY